MNITEEIQKLKELHDNGALTDDEFAQAKAVPPFNIASGRWWCKTGGMKPALIAFLAFLICLPAVAQDKLLVQANKLISQARAKEGSDAKAAIADYRNAMEDN